MLSDLIITSLAIIGAVLSGVVENKLSVCSSSEFPCRDGACVSVQRVCDGVGDCADNSDETACLPGANSSSLVSSDVYKREKRQECGDHRFKCAYGPCIEHYQKCDGVEDCPDGSDETFPLCRTSICQDNLFRCTYGACVDGTAPCNGIQECADNSDELLRRCHNETRINMGQFTCYNEQRIAVSDLCDGKSDCTDGSDETIEVCAGNKCPPYLFQCAYGACADANSDCNGIQDCDDISDESVELCKRPFKPPRRPARPTRPPVTTTPPITGSCALPPYPENGRYVVQGQPSIRPGQPFTGVVFVNMSCDPGYAVDGMSVLFLSCPSEILLHKLIPPCKRYCALPPHHSVDYECRTSKGGATISKPCEGKETIGTTVIPKCRSNYRGSPAYMRCTEDGWNYIAKCAPDCGRTTPQGQEYIIGGKRAIVGEIPWHAGIYSKTFEPIKQICGGSIVTTTAIITAAHCFWKDGEGKQPPHLYAVAVGKIYRPWADKHDLGAQFSDVTEIHMPDQFRGPETNFQNDIAIVMLQTAIMYKPYIRPICVSYDAQLNSRQLVSGALGKISGWGLTSKNGGVSPVLKVVELPYVTYNKCYDDAPVDFREYITGDKICAGFQNGTALCQGDSGGGLAFPDYELGVQRYYLRGIVSTAPRSDGDCDPFQRTTFTELIRHDTWINSILYIEGT